MKIKICGLNDPESLSQVVNERPDMVGFIFYSKSKRFAGKVDKKIIAEIPSTIEKVGVFVNASLVEISKTTRDFGLTMVQIHGDESVEFIKDLRAKINVPVIKVFRIDEGFDFDRIGPYEAVSDYFLFDTVGKNYGGNGKAFDWSLLEQMKTEVPMILSGGLGVEELETIPEALKKRLVGVDMNSRLEQAPGRKDQKLVKEAIEKVRAL